MVKPLVTKLQKKDQDIVQAYNVIDTTVDNVKELRKNILSFMNGMQML